MICDEYRMDMDEKIVDYFNMNSLGGLPRSVKRRDIFSRTKIADFFNHVGFKYGAEVGVKSGGFSLSLCKRIPGLKLLCIDPWMPYARMRKGRAEAHYNKAKRILSDYDVIFLRMKSRKAVKKIKNETLDFVYIDALHDFDNIMMDVILWTQKVKKGGIVSGHDYYHPVGGVIDAVDAYVKAHRIGDYYINRTNKKEIPSWFFVRK